MISWNHGTDEQLLTDGERYDGNQKKMSPDLIYANIFCVVAAEAAADVARTGTCTDCPGIFFANHA